MGKFFDEKADVEEVSPDREQLDVDFANRTDFPEDTRDLLKRKEAGRLKNHQSARVNKLVCEPEDDSEWGCEALINSVVGEGQNKRIASNQLIEISNADVIRVQTEEAYLEGKVLNVR